jgi:DNA-binding SARP family transcriptional activator/lipopolysaccharide biosynthesis regulator YciM
MLAVRLFGSPQLLLNGGVVSVPRRKSRALIYYLATRSEPISRERLLAFFWPDAERASGQQTLRSTLYGLRKALGEALVIDDDSVSLSTDSEVDSRRLEQAVLHPTPSDNQVLVSALELYRGDFLAEFTLPDSAEFEDWAATERERLRRLSLRGWTALSEAREAQGDFGGALDALNRALEKDSLQEDVQRAALRLHYLAGDRAGAIRRYDTFRRLLEEEMGVPPMATTRALYDAIITDTLPNLAGPAKRVDPYGARGAIPIPLPARALPFIGRAPELARMHAAAAARKVALIEGEAGIGKSRLAEEFIAASRSQPLIGRARELEYALPYQPVVEALRGLVGRSDWPSLRATLDLLPVWWDELAHLLPELGHGDARAHISVPVTSAAGNDESRLWEAVYQLLHALARHAPAALLLDDAHWADASSLALLGYLARRVATGGTPLSLIATARPVSARAPLAALRQTLVREGLIEHMVLKRLSADDTLDLARHLSATYAYPLAEQLARMSEGNPYILTELVREAREHNVLLEDGTVDLSALAATPAVPQSVYSLIQARLARLSDGARRVLDVGVAVGREFDFEVVARAAGLSESAVLDALDELRAAALIVPSNGLGYAFDHTLTMEVAYREVGEPRHRMLHRRVAEALEQINHAHLDAVAGLLAWHFAEGMSPERAAPYAWRAGRLAAALPAWKEAIAFYEQALEGESDRTRRAEIFLALGEAHEQAGEIAQAVESFRGALPLMQASRRDDRARLALARALMSQARFAEAIDLVRQVAATGKSESVPAAEFIWGTALSIEGADLDGATEHLQRAATLSANQPDAQYLAQVKFELGGVEAQRGNLERAVALYKESLEASRAANDKASLIWRAFANNNLGYHLHLLGDPAAIDYAREGLRLVRENVTLTIEPFLLSTLGEIELDEGELDAAEAHFREGLAIAEQTTMLERIAGLTANLGLVAARRGQDALAIHDLSTALARAEALGIQHLTAQIHLWLAPLLPASESRAHLAAARAIAESGGRRLLLAEIGRLERK